MSSELPMSWDNNFVIHLAAVLVVGLLLALVLRGVMHGVARRVAGNHPMSADVLRRGSAPVFWLVPLLLLVVASRTYTHASMQLSMLQHGLLIALLAVLTWLGVRCIGVLERIAIRRNPLDVQDNLSARRVVTQAKVLGRIADIVVVFIGVSVILFTIPAVRQVGASLLASAGVAGLALGLAAKPVLGNLLAGVQIALAQPIRLDDVVIIEGEWGRVEEITGTYVVVRIWDERRLIVPLNWFMQNPFQNWTRSSAQLIGSVFLWLDYRVPLAPLRDELQRLCKEAPDWDGRVCVLQVTDTSEHAIQLRALVSTIDSGRGWDLRCLVREGLIAFVQTNYPEALPRWRGELDRAGSQASSAGPLPQPAPKPQQSPSPEDGGPRRSDRKA